ncbi:hypothetical protein J3F83DRAFT_724546 [Trichoderma novae-zelandiae]
MKFSLDTGVRAHAEGRCTPPPLRARGLWVERMLQLQLKPGRARTRRIRFSASVRGHGRLVAAARRLLHRPRVPAEMFETRPLLSAAVEIHGPSSATRRCFGLISRCMLSPQVPAQKRLAARWPGLAWPDSASHCVGCRASPTRPTHVQVWSTKRRQLAVHRKVGRLLFWRQACVEQSWTGFMVLATTSADCLPLMHMRLVLLLFAPPT